MLPRATVASVLLFLVILASTCWGSQPLQPAIEWIPEGAVVVLEVTDPQPLLDLLLAPQLVDRISGTPYYRELRSDQEIQGLLNLITLVEARFGATWKSMVKNLLGGGVFFALGPQNTSTLIVDAADESLLRELHTFFLSVALEGARRKGDPVPLTSTEHLGVTGWVSAEGRVHAVIQNRFLVASDETVFRSIVDRRFQPDLARSKNYLEAIGTVETGNVGRLFVDLERIHEATETEELLSQSSNALESLLSAGMREAFRQSDWMAMSLQVNDKSVLISATSSKSESDPAFSTFASSTSGVLGNTKLPRQIAGMSVYRDLPAFYASKDVLFPERTSGLVFFENMMGIFFSGRDFTDEVLAELAPEIRLVVARQDYHRGVGTPGLQIPAFAAIFRMKHPDEFSPSVEEAWQKALGLLNFTRGQNAEPGLIIDRTEFKGVKYTYAYFAESASTSDTRFNFTPALAMPGNHLILSSTEPLARDLIEALIVEGAAEERMRGVHSDLQVDLSEVSKALEATRESLVQQNMLKQGNSREEAETEVEILLLLLQQIEETQLQVGWKEDSPWSELKIRFALE